MLRAGEIRFCSRGANHKARHKSASDPGPFSNRMFGTKSPQDGEGGASSIDKHGMNNNNIMKGMTASRFAGLNLAFLGITDALKKRGKYGE